MKNIRTTQYISKTFFFMKFVNFIELILCEPCTLWKRYGTVGNTVEHRARVFRRCVGSIPSLDSQITVF